MKNLLLLFLVASLVSCSGVSDSKKKDSSTNEEMTELKDDVKSNTKITKMLNYAVIWKWITDDIQLVNDNTVIISNELSKYWKNGIVQDAYYNSDSKVDKLDVFPNISFFLKAESSEHARSILDNLTIVKKGISSYTIIPVGTKWLGRKTEMINKGGIKKSYVSVWNTITKFDNAESAKLIDENSKIQADAVMKLWNNGNIENVYFDIEGVHDVNHVTDFVFFVNADNEEEARAICNSLPFAQKKIATFVMTEVGVHWLGEYKN